MHRRMGFVISACGMAFVLLSMTAVLPEREFVMFTVGSAFTLLGIFFSVEAAARSGGKPR